LPTKHSHPDETVLAAATALLRQLRRKQAVQFDELKAHLPSRNGSAEYLFTPAISLLYLVGLLDYNAVNDSFVYVGG
jgi:hypothetical protein